jgi:ABC-type branched-subunit amino acid transport system ATPase component/ABC-type branched-subunit amino acid transport system permease subunit
MSVLYSPCDLTLTCGELLEGHFVSDFISFALLGIGSAGVYVLLAQGIVVIYRGSGVLNFALGAFAVIGAYVYVDMREREIPLVGALAISVLGTAAIGVLAYLLVLRPLRNHAQVAKVIATLGMLIVINAAVTIYYGGGSRPFLEPVLPRERAEILGTTMTTDRLYLFGVAAVATLVLWTFYRFTTFGLATSASSENPLAAATLGWSPGLIAACNWALGCGLAAIAGILSLPLIGSLEVTRLTLVVTAALAVALIGKFQSFPLVLLGGLLLGASESVAARYLDPSVQGASVTVPLVVIVLFLVVGGRSLPDRSVVLQRHAKLGDGRLRWSALVPAVVIVAVLMSVVFSDSWTSAFTTSLTAAIIMLSLVLLTGYCGQLSLGQYAVAGFGGFVAARMISAFDAPFELALVCGVLAAIPLGLVFALTAVRTRGLNLAVVTLALGVAMQNILFNNHEYSGGTEGIRVGPQTFLGMSIDPNVHPGRYGVMTLIFFVLSALVVTNLRRGRAGRRMIAVRTNERAAAALGVNGAQTKMYAFAVSAGIAALGGVLAAFQSTTVILLNFTPQQSISVVAFVVLGGLGFALGPIWGSLFIAGGIGTPLGHSVTTALGFDPEVTTQYVALVGGLFVVLTLVANPDGLAPANNAGARLLLRAVRRTPAPTLSESIAKKTPVGVRVEPRELSVSDLQVRFGGVIAVDGVSFSVSPGQVVGLIGPNGAGKTTVIDAVTGFVRPSRGTVTLSGETVSGMTAHARARAGLSRSFQSLELFEDISVRENLLAASDSHRLGHLAVDMVHPGGNELSPRGQAAVEAFDLTGQLDRLPSELSYGQRRLVAIARAVAAGPSVLLLDEPAAGLDEDESSELAALVRRIADEWAMAVLLIEHDMQFVMGTCDEIVVLEFGKQIATGTPADIRRDPLVVKAYLGEEHGSDKHGSSGNGSDEHGASRANAEPAVVGSTPIATQMGTDR